MHSCVQGLYPGLAVTYCTCYLLISFYGNAVVSVAHARGALANKWNTRFISNYCPSKTRSFINVQVITMSSKSSVPIWPRAVKKSVRSTPPAKAPVEDPKSTTLPWRSYRGACLRLYV
jgi:hypothetical protein